MMLSKVLADKLFEAFSIQRWNDRVRPVKLVEMDKHAFKSILTFLIAEAEEQRGYTINWDFIVNGTIFSLLKNIVLSDIKSTVIERIENEYEEEYIELNKWVIEQYRPIIDDEAIMDDFSEFLFGKSQSNERELHILKAANKYSTKREFDIIKSANLSFPDINDIEKRLNKELDEFADIETMYMLINHSSIYTFLCIAEQLRYQVRWGQSLRIPETSVLGHSMYVATITYFLSRSIKACSQRVVNNFYAALFHDLPESVTRDIISPVKGATKDFPNTIKAIEQRICENELYPNLSKPTLKRLKYLLGDLSEFNDEWCNRIVIDGKVIPLKNEATMEINSKYNDDRYNPVDGVLIKICDEIAAFMEAYKSIEHGIKSIHLSEGCRGIKRHHLSNEDVYDIGLHNFFLLFNNV